MQGAKIARIEWIAAGVYQQSEMITVTFFVPSNSLASILADKAQTTNPLPTLAAMLAHPESAPNTISRGRQLALALSEPATPPPRSS